MRKKAGDCRPFVTMRSLANARDDRSGRSLRALHHDLDLERRVGELQLQWPRAGPNSRKSLTLEFPRPEAFYFSQRFIKLFDVQHLREELLIGEAQGSSTGPNNAADA